ncbi:FIST signal transduction protein [Thauera sp. Sel9]|uniref:FIST signal transduction protein n=1 Tax=Thauera sp. Sel9 TaxID=2974299 RepID=UPI0021E1745A|nr:FIST N-terminal domain-containing protein [Thauera sp. Sel9]MCV2219507.1 FIST C-terminal domain-containing protein [Thauera sp. Sel9]
MVQLRSHVAAGDVTADVLSELSAALETAPIEPDFLCVFYGCMHDDEAIWAFVRDRFPDAAILGGTSCGGVMSENGLGGEHSIGLLLVEDPDGDYGTAAVRLQGNAADCAERALHDALEAAGCAGELPELIWIYQAPGQEEAVIDGLRRVVGDRCPIIGGSSADNEVAGDWSQLGPEGLMRDGLVVGVLFSSGGIGFAFQGGYEPSGASGVVTRVGFDAAGESGIVTKAWGRQIISIDGEPAAEVYNRWLGGVLGEKMTAGSNILTDTTMFPVGVDVGKIEGITHYLLIHPDRVLEDGVLSTFAAVEEGTRLFSMRGNKSNLVERAGKVATAAISMLPGGSSSLAGGLVIYCAGCMLAVGNEMPNVSRAVSASFDGAPFLGCFTFGEQGAILGRNAHGNLMISAIAFGK